MNNIQNLIDRQIGNIYNRNNYDTAIRRLRCRKEEDFNGITMDHEDNICEPPVFACKFAQSFGHEHILALANEDGQIAIHNTNFNPSSDKIQRFGKIAHYNAIFDLAWMFGQMKLVSVSGDHTARLFDVSKSDIVQERIFHGHTRSVKTVAFRKEDPAVFATGARDGAIFVWDTRANYSSYITHPDRIISNSHNIPNTPGSGSKFKKKSAPNASNVSGANSVTGLVFQNDMTLISCGAGDGAIKIWDLRKNYGASKREPLPKYVLPYAGNTTRNGFTNLIVDNSGIKLYASCMDNTIYCYNIATYNQEPVMAYAGHQNSSFYVKSSLSADGNYLLSGSSDQNAYIWNIKKSTPLVSLAGHTAEVTCVAWCQSGLVKLVTCGDDMKHKVWRVYDEDYLENWEVEGRGSAIELCDKAETKHIGTPSGRKRISVSTPHSQRKKRKTCEKCQMSTPGSHQNLKNCENCIFSSKSSSKRSADQAELSSIKQVKRQQLEKSGARRLFGTIQEASTSKDSENTLATILEELSPSKESLTANLPNFVVDGEAPHLNYSPQKKRDKDWLTKIRIEQTLRSQMDELSHPSSPKQRRLNDSFNSLTSPKCNNSTKKQKRNASSTSDGRVQSPLLKFFRITNSPARSTCEHQCSSMSVINSNLSVN